MRFFTPFPYTIIAFKGTYDPSYDEAAANIELARIHNGCSDKTGIYYQEGDVTCIVYKGCHENAKAVFCTIEGGGHSWPGAMDLCESLGLPPDKCPYVTTQNIDASRAIWRFFAKHSMPGDED